MTRRSALCFWLAALSISGAAPSFVGVAGAQSQATAANAPPALDLDHFGAPDRLPIVQLKPFAITAPSYQVPFVYYGPNYDLTRIGDITALSTINAAEPSGSLPGRRCPPGARVC
jgi:hypothetical protein